jgi:Spy/CpxP family protein refolding chaperone
MFKISFFSFLVLSLLIIFSSCQESSDPVQQSNINDSPDFLLIADEDPLEIETESAFMIDGTGPMYFAVLDLTEEQKEQIHQIVHDFKDQFRDMHGRWRDGASWEELKEERQALREQINAAIYEILTDEQKAILDDIKSQLENGQYPDILVEHKVAHLTERLDLTTDQQTEVTALFKEYGNLLVAARNDSENRFEFMMTKMELFMELDNKIRALLTEEQLELYEEMKTEHRRKHIHNHRRP